MRAVAVLLALVALAAVASASRGNPEVVDPRGDTQESLTAAPVASPHSDLLAAWFVEGRDTFEVHVRVADVDGGYRQGTTGQSVFASWDFEGAEFTASLNRDAFGSSIARLAVLDPVLGGEQVAVTDLHVDAQRDEIWAEFPRTVTVAWPTTTREITFDAGDAFSALTVQALEGPGQTGCSPCITVDTTAPGRTFTFDQPAASNPHVFVTPPTAPIAVARGATVSVPLSAFAPSGLDLATTLTVSASRDDWVVEDTTRDLGLGAAGTGSTAVHVRVPQFAAPGDACLLTVSGGAFPATVLLVVDDAAGTATKAAAASLAPPPPATDRVARTTTLHLHGNTTTGATGTGRPVMPGRLVDAAPVGSFPGGTPLEFGPTTVRPAGQWLSPPFAAGANLTGQVRVDAWVKWSGVSGVKVRALVGAAPLPLDWDGRTAVPGVVVLDPANTGSGTSGQLAASASLATPYTLGAGDRLAVAVYVEANGNGGALLQYFAKSTPTRLTVNLEEPALPRPLPGVVPSTGAAAFRGTFAPPLGASGLAPVAATLKGAADPVPLTVAAVPVDVVHGAATDAPTTESPSTVPFSRLDVGVERVHRFTVEPATKRLVVTLRAPSTGDPTNDNDFDLAVRRVSDGAVVRASRSEGPVETVVLGPELLARYGAGQYDALVRFDRVASTATSFPYTVEIVEHTSVTQKGARFAAAAVWTFRGKALGDYTLTLARGAGESVQTVYRLTEVGPTLAPTADFSYHPLLPVSGQPVNFTDLSVDLDGKLARWTWRFGDGTTSNERHPRHAFPRPGAYSVDLTVADDFNATAASITRVVDVGNAPPVAAFTVEPQVGTVGQPARFTDRSFDPDGNVSAREWSFDDGSGSSEATVEHVFDVAGVYNVSLTVFDEPRSLLAGSRVVRSYVVVDPGAASSGRPTPDFEAPLNPVAGRPVRFVDASFWEEGLLERRWDFGDGGVSNATDPLHTYAHPGEYAVTLTVFPPGRTDLTASLTRSVRVAGASGLAASFTVDPPAPSTSDVVRFEDTTTALQGSVTRHWDFGDGTTAAGPTVTHVFARAGTFTVRLTVSDPDGAQAVREHVLTVRRAALVATPAPDAPRGGTTLHYKADYDRGVEHKEDYAATWREVELAGLLKGDADYLATRGAYVYGTARPTPTPVLWQGGAAAIATPGGGTTRVLGAAVSQEAGPAVARALAPASAAIGSRPVDLSALDAPPPTRDDLEDGLFRLETVLEGSGIQVRRSTTVLDGALHTDVRTVMSGEADDPMRLVTEVALAAPAGAWVATWDGDAVRALPVAGADGLAYDLGGYANRWFAVYDPATRHVAGAVVSGDVTSIALSRRGAELVVRVDHVGLGEVRAAEYLVAYEVTDGDATRYAGVMEIARQDDEEIGIAVLGEGRAAALAWAGGRANLGVATTRGLEAWWDRANGVPAAWTIELDAPSTDDGKAMRVVLPGSVAREGGVRVLLDGEPLSPLAFEALADDGTLVLVVPIEHFSRHELTIQAVLPGLPRAFLWLGLALGVVVGGGAVFGTHQVRSRAATRGLGEKAIATPDVPILPGVPPGAQRALGEIDSPAAADVRSALLRKLTADQGVERARYARCAACGSPVRYAPGETTTACPRCGADNVHGGGNT